MIVYFYLVAAAALVPLLDIFFDVLHTENSWWLVFVLFVAFFIGFILLHIAFVAVCIALVDTKKESDRFAAFYRNLIDVTLPMLFKLLRVKINVTGEDKLPENKRVLLVCNHINDLDPAVIISSFPELELGFIAKKEVYTLLPFVSKAMSKLKCLPIDRENNREGVKTILKAVEYIKEDKVSIGIFPEGYTSLDGELQEFRNGAFKIATKAKCPVVVCTLINSEKILKNIFRRKTEVFLDVLEVIPSEEVAGLRTDEIGARVHAEMLENISKRRNENPS